jgi:hypothetical protein
MRALWTLRGAGVLLLCDTPRALALVHYESSPVGAYDEFAVIKFALRGPSITEMAVTSPASQKAGRALWGFPKTLGNLSWSRKGRRLVFQSEREIFRFRITKFSFPVQARAWTNQNLNGQEVRVPIAISGHARIAFRGKQWALFLEGFELQVFAPEAVFRKLNFR